MAQSAKIPLLQPENAADPAFIEQVRALSPDIAIVVSYGQILKEEFLSIPRQACFNLHASILPKYRGASPIAAAILAGDSETGISVQRMVKKLDAGDVLSQKTIPIQAFDTTGDLTDILARHGAELLLETISKIEKNEEVFTPQDEAKVTYAPKLKKESGEIDWKRSAQEVDRQVRAMTPWPGAFTSLVLKRGATRIKVLAGLPQQEGKGAPGTILSASAQGIDIACVSGSYRIKAVQPEGGKPLPINQFLQGHPVH